MSAMEGCDDSSVCCRRWPSTAANDDSSGRRVVVAKSRSGRVTKTGRPTRDGARVLIAELGSVSDPHGLLRSLAVDFRPVAGLRANPSNARTHSDRQVEQLAASIRTFGFLTPILIDEKGMVL